MKLTKADILAVPHTKAFGFEPPRKFSATGVTTDSRTVRSGDLFVALKGETFDGHNFVSSAVQAGAAGIVVEQAWAEANQPMLTSLNLPRLVVADTVRALGELARGWRRKFRIPVLAVAGSNGKTTTKEMIRSVLAEKFTVLATEGNLNNHIGVPQTMFRLEKKHRVAVVEIGTNHPGEIDYLCAILEPTHGIITNIGREHLEFFGSLDGVANAEGELFRYLAAHRGHGFVNGDDRYLPRQARQMKRTTLYGFRARSAEVKGSVSGIDRQGCAAIMVKAAGRKPFDIALRVPGEHNAINALAAAAVGSSFKVPAVHIKSALEGFVAASKRMQVFTAGGITVLNDTYNANPDSVLAALRTMKAIEHVGKKIAVLADMLELGPGAVDEHRQVGEELKALGVVVLLTFGPLAQHLHDAAQVAEKSHFSDKSALIDALLRIVTAGDVVLVKGSRGLKMEEVVARLQQQQPQRS